MGVLDDKVALVTGASNGISTGIAKLLAAAGASVVVNYASSKEGAGPGCVGNCRTGRQGVCGAG